MNRNIYTWDLKERIFWIFSFIIMTSFLLFTGLKSPIFLLIPVLLYGIALSFTSPVRIIYLFFFLLPFSIEVQLSGGLGTDLPAEPLMWLLFAITLGFVFKERLKNVLKILLHPISLLLITHLFWILFTALFSQNQLVSFKYFIAKTWYFIPFYLLPFYLLKNDLNWFHLMRYLLLGMLIATVIGVYRHSTSNFSFSSVNSAVSPLFRNHVNYACLIVLSLPYLVFYLYHRLKSSLGYIMGFFILFYASIALYLSYTRVAYIAISVAFLSWILLKFKLLRLAILTSAMVVLIGAAYFINQNEYLEYAPNYERTIAHSRFDNLVEATYRMEDISTMERVYRWVAGYHMILDKPWIGFGPGSFYFSYPAYTVSSFKTYVSDNPEKSGIHNYFLMVGVEQGIPGLIIFLILYAFSLFRAIRLYHKIPSGFSKNLVLVALIQLILLACILLINDMLEVAKIGPFFFLALSIIVGVDLKLNSNKIATS